MPRSRSLVSLAVGCGLLAASALAVLAPVASATNVGSEAQLRAAFADLAETSITLSADISLTDCGSGDLFRDSAGVALTIDGAGHTISQTCSGFRVMTTKGSGLTLHDLTVTGGNVEDGSGTGLGGGIYSATSGPLVLDTTQVIDNSAGGSTGGLGGGFFAGGPVTLDHAVISRNVSTGGTSIFGGLAGGFASSGTVNATDTVISDNVAEGAVTGGGDAAGVFGNSDMTFVRSTISGNTTQAGSTSGSGATAGIAINANLTLVDSTVTGNSSQGPESSGGGIGAGGKITLVYSTVAGNSAATNSANVSFDGPAGEDIAVGSVIADPLGGAPNCGGTVTTSQGHNYDTDGTCGFANAVEGDTSSGSDPMLAPLADNGGSTQTMLPLSGSPLLDAIAPASCQDGAASGVSVDQRGITRPQGAGCDIGAVEVEVAVTPTTSAPTPPPTTSPINAVSTTAPGTPAPPATPISGTPTYTG